MERLYQWVMEDPKTRIAILAAVIGVGGVVLGSILNSLVWPWLKASVERLIARAETKFSKKKFEYRYLDWVISEHENLPLLPSTLVPVTQPLPKELDRLYVSLSVASDSGKQAEMGLGAALQKNSKLVMLGDPGAGKTTMLHFMALTFALARRRRSSARTKQGRQRDEKRIQAARKRVKEEYGYGDYPLPVFVFLNRLRDVAGWPPGRSILDAVRDELRANELLRDIPADFFDQKLSRGECIFLLDAFDELGSQSARDAVAGQIGKLAATAQQGNRFVVTSRIVGYSGQLNRYGFDVLKVQRLSWELITQLVTKWYDALDEKRLAEQLLSTFKSNPRIAELAVNPMLLSLIVLVQYVRRLIPDRRHVLYDECVKILVERRYAPPEVQAAYNQVLPGDEATQILQEVAMRMHQARLREIPRDELEDEYIPDILREMPDSVAARVPPAGIIRNIEERSQLLIERGINEQGNPVMAFSHLTFQEYLASVSYKEMIPRRREDIVSDEVVGKYVSDREWWEEAALLYAAQLNNQQRASFMKRLQQAG
jgi:predicted NACHT family NTPase